MDEQEIKRIVEKVLQDYGTEKSSDKTIPVEASARHIHLNKQAVEILFGKGASLTKKRELSQPGQFLSEQRLKIVTAKGEFQNVAVLGPERKDVQVELSVTDCRTLGIKAPVNLSGDLTSAATVCLISEAGCLEAENSVIVAKNHIHMTQCDADNFGVKNSQSVKVKMNTERKLTFEDVIIRVDPSFKLSMHIDFDEANACCLDKASTGSIL